MNFASKIKCASKCEPFPSTCETKGTIKLEALKKGNLLIQQPRISIKQYLAHRIIYCKRKYYILFSRLLAIYRIFFIFNTLAKHDRKGFFFFFSFELSTFKVQEFDP